MPHTFAQFQLGETVEVIDATHGWGPVSPGEIGIITYVWDADGHYTHNFYRADFPSMSGWGGEAQCFRSTSKTTEPVVCPGVKAPEGYKPSKGETVFVPRLRFEGIVTSNGTDGLKVTHPATRSSFSIVESDEIYLIAPAPEYPAYTEPQVGDKVMVVGSKYSWNGVSPLMIGTVSRLRIDSYYNDIEISIKGVASGWRSQVTDFLLVERFVNRIAKIETKEVESLEREGFNKSVAQISDKLCTLRNLPTDSVDKVVGAGLRQKARLNAILGHNAENNFRTVIDLPTTESDWEEDYANRELKAMIASKMEWDWADMSCSTNTWTDGRGNSRKITKMVLAEMNRWHSHPLKDYFVGERGWEERTFGQKLGEAMSARASKDVVVISTNLFDYITSSGCYWDLSAFSSCHGFEGCHFNGNLAYWNDDFTAISYVAPRDRLDYKIGRSWLYLPEPNTVLVEAKSYGYFANHLRKRMREHIERKLDAFSAFEGTWKKRRVEYNGISGPGVNYFDHGGVDVAYTTHAYPGGLHSHPRLQFSEALCLSCGDETDHLTGGVCDSCDSRCQCYACGDMIDDDDSYSNSNGDTYCESCYDERYTRCNRCDDEVWRDDARHHDGDCYCDSCFSRYYFSCDGCGEAFSKDDLVDTGSREYCEECAESRGWRRCNSCSEWSQDYVCTEDEGAICCSDCTDSYVVCPDCNKSYSDEGELTSIRDLGKCVCPDCRDDYVECYECDGYFEHTVEIDGRDYCVKCAAEELEGEQDSLFEEAA